MFQKLVAVFLLVVSCLVLKAQVFTDVTESFGIAALNASTIYGAGSSCFDVNEDGWDDLTLCLPGGATRLYMNHQGTFQLHEAFNNIHDAKTCLWGDYDEDGDNDLFVIKRDGPSQLFVQTDSLVFVNQTSLLNYPFNAMDHSFGAALGDYNRDSYLDLYVANYSTASAGGIKSKFLTNNQNGSFIFSLHGYNRNHFQPVFIDLYRDLFQDIFVIVDFRVGSEYFLQGTNGVFTDYTLNGAFGLDVAIDAMSNSWCDYDNDADLDVYMTNTPTDGNFLMQNDGANQFSNVAQSVGAGLFKWTWSALWLDIENDGWNDLIVNERNVNLFFVNNFGNHVLRNNQGVFIADQTTGLSGLPYGYFTSSKGDFNNDGLYDIYLGAETGQQSRVFQNATVTDNNFVKFRLNGRLSNRNGVGTHVDYYVNGSHRIHYTQLGENYLSQNSQNIILGIGANEQIDSLKLSWLSGVVDTYYAIPANSTHVFQEGESLPQIVASKPFLCPNGTDSLQLSINGWPFHTWENGITENSIWVNAPGEYFVEVGTGYGHTLTLSYNVAVAIAGEWQVSSTSVLCAGDNTGTVEIVNSNTQELLYAQHNLAAGLYSVPLLVVEGCVVQQEFVISEPLPFALNIDSLVAACEGMSNGQVVISGMNGTAPYSGFNSSNEITFMNLAAGTYTNYLSDANGCLASYSFEIDEVLAPTITGSLTSESVFGLGSIALEVIGNNPPYIAIWQSGFEGFNYSSLTEGNYLVSIVDSFGCTTDTSFTVLFNTVEEESSSLEFIVDWKTGQLSYSGTERLFGVEVYNNLGQLIFTKSSLGANEFVHLNVSPQPIYISSSKGNFRTKIILK